MIDAALPAGLPSDAGSALAPAVPGALETALAALMALQFGAATGEWAAFEAMLADQVSFYAPVPGFDGLLHGKAEARRLFAHHSAHTRTTWTLMRILANGAEIGFEVRAEGAIDRDDDYANNLMMVLHIEGDRIVQFREYASTTGYAGHAIGRGAFDALSNTKSE